MTKIISTVQAWFNSELEELDRVGRNLQVIEFRYSRMKYFLFQYTDISFPIPKHRTGLLTSNRWKIRPGMLTSSQKKIEIEKPVGGSTYMLRSFLMSAGPLALENSQWNMRISLFSSSWASALLGGSWSLVVLLGEVFAHEGAAVVAAAAASLKGLAVKLGGKNSLRKASSSHAPKFSAPLMCPPSNS